MLSHTVHSYTLTPGITNQYSLYCTNLTAVTTVHVAKHCTTLTGVRAYHIHTPSHTYTTYSVKSLSFFGVLSL